jgi:glucose/arabinose dehydrogenase
LWNHHFPVGKQMKLVCVKNNTAAGYEVFAKGSLQTIGPGGRPCKLLEMPDGTLLIWDEQCRCHLSEQLSKMIDTGSL